MTVIPQVKINLCKLLSDAFQQLVRVKIRQTGPLGSHVHPVHVQGWPEQPHLPIYSSIGFHTFIELLGIVEYLQCFVLNFSL